MEAKTISTENVIWEKSDTDTFGQVNGKVTAIAKTKAQAEEFIYSFWAKERCYGSRAPVTQIKKNTWKATTYR